MFGIKCWVIYETTFVAVKVHLNQETLLFFNSLNVFTPVEGLPLCLDTIMMYSFAWIVKPLGCFKDTGRRAIPGVDGRYPIVRGYYRRRKDAIRRCALVALRFGYRVFAVQHQGWCATGPKAHLTYRKYGRTNRCRNGKGGPWANDVYAVTGKMEVRVTLSMHNTTIILFLFLLTYWLAATRSWIVAILIVLLLI